MSQRPSKPDPRAQRVELNFLEGVRRRVPGNEQVLEALGHLYTRVGRYQDGLEVDLELTRLSPEAPQNWYNLACSQSLLGEVDSALQSLKRAVDIGFDDWALIRKDEDLRALRGNPAFEALLRGAAGGLSRKKCE